jgi:hypothetical protein
MDTLDFPIINKLAATVRISRRERLPAVGAIG